MPLSIHRPLPIQDIVTSHESVSLTETWTPEKNYGLLKTPNGHIRVDVSPSVKNIENVVYRFKGKGEERYIGATKRKVGKRICEWNHHFFKGEGSLLAKAVHENPENFVFGIVKKVSSNEDLDACETTAIKVKKSIEHGYNTRNGGGGGTVETTPPDRTLTPNRAFKKIQNEYTSPKWKKLKNDDRVRDTLSASEKSQKNALYIFKIMKKGKVSYYIGKASNLKTRLASHFSYINNAEKLKLHDFHKKIASCYKHSSLGIIRVSKLLRKGLTLSEAEASYIRLYKSMHRTLENKNKGGGGGASKSRAVKKLF